MNGADAEQHGFLQPLQRTLDWLLSLRDAQGRIQCPEHRLEHTGKSACAAILALELFRATGCERCLEAAVQQGRRLVARLENEPNSPCYTFRPGRHDPYNCSNSVIDGGACADALASLVLDLGDRLAPEDARAFRDAALLHARTYLRYAVLDKGIPAQRAWGLTGLAAAAALEPDPLLLEAAEGAFDVLAEIQRADGSFPYHPVEWGAGHPGAADASAFYQSRVTGFQLEALRRLGREPTPRSNAGLERGLDFLEALVGPDGIKCGLVEAKPWYWGAEYEVASHPFDVYALLAGWRRFGRPEFARAALRVQAAWAMHLDPDGRPRSHLAGPGRGRSYQCPVFWAGHACWAARALPELGRAARELAELGPEAVEPRVRLFEETELARLESADVVAWVRGSRGPYNGLHGSPWAGGLLRAVRADGQELLVRRRHALHQEGEWSGAAGLPSPGRGWRSGGGELRFSAWLARNELRGRRPLGALAAPWRMLGRAVLRPAGRGVSSAFVQRAELRALDGELAGRGVELAGALAHRDGQPLEGSRLRRRFWLAEGGLQVEDRLLSAGAARNPRYRLPAAAMGAQVLGDGHRYQLG